MQVPNGEPEETNRPILAEPAFQAPTSRMRLLTRSFLCIATLGWVTFIPTAVQAATADAIYTNEADTISASYYNGPMILDRKDGQPKRIYHYETSPFYLSLQG